MESAAEAVLNGDMCEDCGHILARVEGFPQLCASCAATRREDGRDIRATGYGTYQDVTPMTKRMELMK